MQQLRDSLARHVGAGMPETDIVLVNEDFNRLHSLLNGSLTSDLLALKLSSDDREFLIDNLPVVENPSSPVAASVARAAQCIRMLKYA